MDGGFPKCIEGAGKVKEATGTGMVSGCFREMFTKGEGEKAEVLMEVVGKGMESAHFRELWGRDGIGAFQGNAGVDRRLLKE